MALAVVLLLGVGLLLGGGGLLLWSKARRARWRALPRSRAKQARPGTSVKVVGRLRAREPVRTPLTGVDCVYYRLRVWEEDGDNVRQLFTETEYAEGWELEDESGRIGLEGAEASFSFLDEHEYSPGGLLDTSGLEREELLRYVQDKTGRVPEKSLRLKEERLELGDSVVAVGQVALGKRGPVLVAGPKLEVMRGTEQEVQGYRDPDLISWVMLAAGVLLCVAAGAWMWEEPEPVPVVKDQPLKRLGPARSGARSE
ncbi:hypothetical protein ACN28I_29170 [Archangium gephyra]|uniref:hypothetical protein n=1 Tax=Archangium gephyra TaxID=48 RepID=UPI003B7F5F44